MKIEEFINILKPMVRYENGVHMMGSTILTNQEMKVMLETMLGDDYINLTNAQQKHMRRKIFKELKCIEDI